MATRDNFGDAAREFYPMRWPLNGLAVSMLTGSTVWLAASWEQALRQDATRRAVFYALGDEPNLERAVADLTTVRRANPTRKARRR